jgi:hypothetical protein
MGILIKKYQKGGGLFSVGEVDMGEKDHTTFLKDNDASMVGGKSGRSSGYRGHTGKSAADKQMDLLKDGLTSDITYYQAKKDALLAQLKDMQETDDNAEQTPEYKTLLNEYHKLETQQLPAIKRMAKLYSTAKTAFTKKGASNAPAITGNQAVVLDAKNGVYKIVSNEELVRNAPNYQLLTANEVLTERASNPQFSGFTDLGRVADTIINNAYGQESFSKYIKQRVSNAGYIKGPTGAYTAPNGKVLDIRGTIASGDDMKTKSNLPALKEIYSDILANNNSASNYAEALAVQDLYNKSKQQNELYSEASEKDLYSKLIESRDDVLARSLNSALYVDQADNSSDSFMFKDVKRNVVNLAALRMAKNREQIEVPGIKSSSEMTNMLFNTPASTIDKGSELLEDGFKYAYEAAGGKEKRGDYDSAGDSDSYARRTIDNNSFINNAKDPNAMITTVDGTPLQSLVTNGNMQFVTIPKGTKLYIMLAPVVTDTDGHERVSFNSKQQQLLDSAITEAYEELDREGYSQEALSMSADRELKAKAVKKVNEKLVEKGVNPDNLKVKMVLAFDVLFEVDSDKKGYRFMTGASPDESKFLNDVNDDVWTRRVKKTKVFVPLSDSFFSNMFANDAFGSDYVRTMKYNDLMGMMKKSNESNYKPSNLAKTRAQEQYNKNKDTKSMEDGGELEPAGAISPQEAVRVLFD